MCCADMKHTFPSSTCVTKPKKKKWLRVKVKDDKSTLFLCTRPFYITHSIPMLPSKLIALAFVAHIVFSVVCCMPLAHAQETSSSASSPETHCDAGLCLAECAPIAAIVRSCVSQAVFAVIVPRFVILCPPSLDGCSQAEEERGVFVYRPMDRKTVWRE